MLRHQCATVEVDAIVQIPCRHRYASDEQSGEASLAALAIVGFGILPVIVLTLRHNPVPSGTYK